MADGRRRVAVLLTLLSLALSSACAGVPKSGAVHRQDLPANAPAPAGVVQVAAGPQPHQGQTSVVASLLSAMSQHDTNVAQQFLTPDYADQWETSFSSRTVVYSQSGVPSLKGNTVSVSLTQSGTIDSSQTYNASGASITVSFTLVSIKGGTWQVSDISQPGLFVRDTDLPDYLTPWHVYFPSSAATTAAVPRLVPDTVFLPPGASPSQLLSQLLGGPSAWISPSIYVIVPVNPKNGVNQATPNTRNLTTIVDLHLAPDPHAGRPVMVTGRRLDILKAQIAYTLNVQSFHTGSIQLSFDGVSQGSPFSLASLPKGYDPDVLPVSAPVYYLSDAGQVVASTRAQAPATSGATGVPGATAADTTETVLEHAEGVQQLAVASPTETTDSTANQMLAGVRMDNGVPTLVLAAAGDTSATPWTPVALPPATSLSTPSFDVTGTGVWTVATSGATSTIYRVPLVDGVPGTPVIVPMTPPEGVTVSGIASLKLSRDGSRVAVIVKGGNYAQAYVGVVSHPAPNTGVIWSVGSLRPVITVPPGTTDTDADVFWADQTEIGVVVQNTAKVPNTKPVQTVTTTKVYRVSSDGYTVTTDGATAPALVDGAPTDATVQLAGGPHQPWVASVNHVLTRQPTTDPSTDQTANVPTTWTQMGPGSYPTYAG